LWQLISVVIRDGGIKMFNVGRLCVKIAGRDANKKCIIIEDLDNGFVTIDGETRRRKCNTKHLYPTKVVYDIKKGASHTDISKLFSKELGVELKETKKKTETKKPVKIRKSVQKADTKKVATPKKEESKKTTKKSSKKE
jgi:large subunit ribosomal protein L14e